MGLSTAFTGTAPGQVAANLNGLERKQDVVAIATANTSLSGTAVGATVGGRTTVSGDRLLLTGQTAPAENGIYVQGATTLSRAADLDVAEKVVSGWRVRCAGDPAATKFQQHYYCAPISGVFTLGTTAVSIVAALPSPGNITPSLASAFSGTAPGNIAP